MNVMKKQIARKIAYVFAAVGLMFTLSGCSLIPELSLTEEQRELIAEYSAGLLVKYQIGHRMGLTPVSAADFASEEEPADASEEISIEISSDDAENTEGEIDNPESNPDDLAAEDDTDSIEMVSSTVPMSEVFGINGFDINFDRYEFTEVYPEEESETLIFSMQAAPGMDLLILHFSIANTSDSANDCNLLTGTVKARATVNNGSRIPAQATILDNDLLNYNNTLEGYASEDAVLVFEVPEETRENASSINLILNGNLGDNLYRIL